MELMVLSKKQGSGKAYEYLSEEESRLYDKAEKGAIPADEANRIIVESLERRQAVRKSAHAACKY